MPCLPDRNLLVISDLHLGEDLRPNMTDVSYLRRIARLERELESFLTHYTAERLGGRPWRLVIAGDMVDFMSVMILPTESDPEHQGLPAEDSFYGLGYGERQTIQKLRHVVERHRGVFGRLARFVAAGNELVIVVGNHDVEFQFPSVQKRFVEVLAELSAAEGAAETGADGGPRNDNDSRVADMAAQVTFCPWFYYEEELIYVEHGHQYDEYCSFDYQLHPVEHASGGVAMSVAHAGIRYFSNLVPSMDPGKAEVWGFLDYARWAIAQGAKGLGRMSYLYGLMVWKLVEVWSRLTDRVADEARHTRHVQALRRLAVEYRMAEEKLEQLDGLRSVPVVRRLHKILRAFFVDRLALGVGTFWAVAIALLVAPGGWRLAATIGVLLVAVGLSHWLAQDRMLPCEDSLRRVPQAIGRILRAPFIVFGHSHMPEEVPLEGGATYYNVGTWVADNLRGAFTHLIVCRGAGAGRPSAELRQWRDGASAPFLPTAATGASHGETG